MDLLDRARADHPVAAALAAHDTVDSFAMAQRRAASPARRRWVLLHRIGRRWRTRVQTIRIGGVSLDFVRIAEPDKVLDEVADLETHRSAHPSPSNPPLNVPYWAELWDSAIGIAQFIERQSRQMPIPIRAMDLGCGMGLVGMAAAAAGWQVLMADYEPPALLFARLNTLAWRERVQVRRVDWQHDRLRERFDRIVSGDVLYERRQWPFLEAFWRAHLAEGGSVWIGEPGRQTGIDFVPWVINKGWRVEQSSEEVGAKRINILELRMTFVTDCENHAPARRR